jgi:mannose-6-phosphate isomerase
MVPRIWGRRSLRPIYPAFDNLPEPIGEAWLSGVECVFAEGPFAGRPLGQAWDEMSGKWKGTGPGTNGNFPLLAKFLFPESKLSIQVHPDDAYAARVEAETGGSGKTEMWHVLAADPGAEVLLGLAPGMDAGSLRRAIADGSVETKLRRVAVAPGDTIYIPAGTVHAIGPGVLLCELQQYSDITYRLFDYNRVDARGNRRALHVEKALDVIEFGSSAAGMTKPVSHWRGPVEVTELAACRYFWAERWRLERPAEVSASKEHFDLLIVLAGTGTITGDMGERDYHPGETWFVAADHTGFRIEPASATTLLRSSVADLGSLKQRLAAEGVTKTEMAGFLFE